MKSLISFSLCLVSVMSTAAVHGQTGAKAGGDLFGGGSPQSGDLFGAPSSEFGGDPFDAGPASAGGVPGGMVQSGGNARPGLRFSVQEEKTQKGKNHITQYTATRKKTFWYVLGSLKVYHEYDMGHGGAVYGGGGGYGGEGGYGGGMQTGGMAGDGGDGMGMGGYGSPGGMAGAQGGMPGMGANQAQPDPAIMIHAYIFDEKTEPSEATAGQTEPKPLQRSKIELVVANGNPNGQAAMGMGGYGGEGMGMGGGVARATPSFVRLQSLTQPLGVDGKKNRTQLAEDELTIVSNSICQSIWKEDAVKDIQKYMADPKRLADTEALLKAILTEEYDIQLKRQGIEIARVEDRITKLREEVSRRRAAKDRVIDVQLGRIVLEAQGLLGK